MLQLIVSLVTVPWSGFIACHWGMVGEATDGMVIEYNVESHSSSTSAGGEGAVPEGGFTHPYTKHLGDRKKDGLIPQG